MVLSFSFEQCFGPFIMLLVEGSSETGLFRHLSNHVFPSSSVPKYISYEDQLFFWKVSKLNLDFENAKKNSEKVFCFVDNIIWRSWNKLCLLRGEYLSSAVNVLTRSPKILHISTRDLLSQWSRNMVKVLFLRFQQCFGPYTMLLVKRSCETALFRHLPNHVLRSP